MSRLSGCPFNIRDYSVEIKNSVTGAFERVKGLSGMRVELEAETEDGRTGAALWSEMFIKSRGVSGTLEGRPIADRITGARDPGQALLHRAAMSEGGCENDQTLRVADAIGRAVEYDCVVTKEEHGADGDGETVSWEWEGVGSPRPLDYVQAEAVSFSDGEDDIDQATLAVGETATVKVCFDPEEASNRRFSFSVADEGVAAAVRADGQVLTLRGASVGETTLTVKTMNNGLTASLAIAVTAAGGGA